MSYKRRRKIRPAEMVHHPRRRIAMILAWTKDDTAESCLANEERQAALWRNLIAVGEAIKHLARAVIQVQNLTLAVEEQDAVVELVEGAGQQATHRQGFGRLQPGLSARPRRAHECSDDDFSPDPAVRVVAR